MPAKLDLVGKRFNRLLVIGENPIRASNGKVRWDCVCDCGNITIVDGTTLKQGATGSCGCFMKECTSKRMTTHGKSKESLYDVWQAIKRRCYDENNAAYDRYGAVGITVDEDFINDFVAFEKELGLKPNDGLKYTVDRIDGNKGYIRGNLRWVTQPQQSRNRGKFKSNKSGHTGIHYHDGYKDNEYWCVAIHHLDGSVKTKCFNITKLGDKALEMAIEYRKTEILKLNEQGADYTENHGKERRGY